MYVGVVANPRAGKRAAVDRATTAARELLDAGHRCDVVCTEAEGAACELAREMAQAGCEVVAAAGGDGTINEVVQGLVGTGAALAVIPAGLANVWALDLGLKGPHGSLSQLLREGLVFDTDLGAANGRQFLMMAGIGFDAEVVNSVISEHKQRWAQLAYVAAAVRGLGRWQRVEARVAIDGCPRLTMDLFGVVVTNVNKYGGVLDLAPASKLDDGLFDAIVFRDAGPARRVRSALLADHRVRGLDGCASTFVCEQLEIETTRPLLVHVDAEMAGVTPCQITISRRALPVLLPRAAQSRYLAPGRTVQARSSRSYSAVVTEPTP